MTTNFTGREAAVSPTDAEGVMFAATPAWERRGKSSRFGGRKVAAEPRAFAPDARPSMTRDTAALPPGATITPSTLAAGDGAGLAAPISGSRAVRSGGGVSPVALALALGAVAVLGSAGWIALRNQETVVDMTPASTTSEIATAPITPEPEPVTLAQNTVAPTQAVPQAPRRTAAAARVRPAAAPVAATAGDTGVNASATLPDGPQPYATLSPTATPQPVNPAAPAIIEAAPPVQESIPSTPPIAPEPAPAVETPETDMPPT